MSKLTNDNNGGRQRVKIGEGRCGGVEYSASCYSDSTHLITPSQANDSPQFNGGEERGWGR